MCVCVCVYVCVSVYRLLFYTLIYNCFFILWLNVKVYFVLLRYFLKKYLSWNHSWLFEYNTVKSKKIHHKQEETTKTCLCVSYFIPSGLFRHSENKHGISEESEVVVFKLSPLKNHTMENKLCWH